MINGTGHPAWVGSGICWSMYASQPVVRCRCSLDHCPGGGVDACHMFSLLSTCSRYRVLFASRVSYRCGEWLLWSGVQRAEVLSRGGMWFATVCLCYVVQNTGGYYTVIMLFVRVFLGWL
ncbi:hypothetical protein M011DRAFT_153410 [Sporormia fimetaria CBS 119925]|uniref:Uncharacterized protein n=1 Tax=Sporormia fimetaria CBS 119925 TaxID=1340428 RepID=A0A6A6V4X9_9PLEO|nr:hypothetical protein M011DRAFT_153410 [Sporormia fimetaria CBS 119925]